MENDWRQKEWKKVLDTSLPRRAFAVRVEKRGPAASERKGRV